MLAAGALAVPINLRWSFSEAQGAIHSVGAQIIFIDEEVLATFGGLAQDHGLRCIILGASSPKVGMDMHMPEDIANRCRHVRDLIKLGDGPHNLDIQTGADGAAMICFTSGTAGAPKGAVLSHAALHSQVGWACQVPHLLLRRWLFECYMSRGPDMQRAHSMAE